MKESTVSPGITYFDELLATIRELRASHKGLITIALPSSTAPIFLRKQLEDELGSFYGIRFYSHDEVYSLLQDSTNDEFIFRKSNHVENIADLKRISDKVFKSKQWQKINAIESTLQLINGINKIQFDALENINEYAYKCAKEYMTLRGCNFSKSPKGNIDPHQIIGKLILISHENIKKLEHKFLSKYSGLVEKHIVISSKTGKNQKNYRKFDNSFDELNAALNAAVKASSQTSLNSMAIVVPNDAYKQLLISIAKVRDIPIAGSQSFSAYDDQVLIAARYLIANIDSHTNEFFVTRFFERFSWLKASKNRFDLITVFSKLRSARNVGEYILPLTEFLESGFKELSKHASESKRELIESEFSILKQIQKWPFEISPIEIEFLLNKLSNSISERIETIGNGIYIAKPNEILGAYFDDLFICGMSTNFLNEEKEDYFLLNEYEAETLGVKEALGIRTSETNKNIVDFLISCANNVNITCSENGTDGKKNEQFIEFDEFFTNIEAEKPYSILDLFEHGNTDLEIEYYSMFFASTPNNINLLFNEKIETLSATAIETLATCPFKFFITKALNTNLVLEDENLDIIHALNRGNIIHNALEKSGMENFELEKITRIIDETIQTMIEKNSLPNFFSRTINKIEILKLIEAAIHFDQLQRTNGSEIYSVEEKISGQVLSMNASTHIKGKIDRIDKNNDDTFTIIDYKTSSLKESEDFYIFGKRLQLGIYSILLEEKLKIKSIDYWYLNNLDRKTERLEMNSEIIEQTRTLIANLLSILENGVVAPRNYSMERPKKVKKIGEIVEVDNCEHCEVASICYVDHQNRWKSIEIQNKSKGYRTATMDKVEEVANV